MIVRTAAALVIVVCMLACGEKTAAVKQTTFAVDSSRGFPVITVQGRAERWQAAPLFTIGAIEGGAIEFGSVRSVLLDSAGVLVVVDDRNRTVNEFDSTGAFVRQIGRDGAGPGEYRNPYSVAWLDGNLALLDPGNTRLAVFDRAGKWVTSWPVQPLTGGQMVRLYRTPPAFSAFAYRRIEGGSQNLYVPYTPSGPQDTVALAPRPTDLERGIMCNRPDKAISFYSNPYAASFVQIPLGGGRQAIARTDAYRIAVLGKAGDTTLVITGDATPSPVTDADWKAGMADWEKFRVDWPTAQCDRTSFTRPPVKPVLNWLFLDGEGRLWVEVESSEGIRYDVFDDAGRPVASVDGLPRSDGLDPSVTGRRAAFVVRDSTTDAAAVRVFRLQR
jgi:hypothetical protein